MAGILDNKSRVMDVFITPQGRKQMASGKLVIEYASFTDRHIVYTSGSSGALEDLTDRIYFEAASTENDQIIYETDSDGNLVPFSSGIYTITGQDVQYVSGGVYSGNIDLIADAISTNAANHFKSHKIIGTRDLFKEDKGSKFVISNTTSADNNITASFTATTSSPINTDEDTYTTTIDDINSVFQSSRFGHLKNFEYLPPISRPFEGAATGSVLANYSQINSPSVTSWDDMASYLSNYNYEYVHFSETSTENNLICQIFEEQSDSANAGNLEKLVVIDYGTFSIESNRSAHVFFAGKLFRDTVGNLCFANLLTLVFDDEVD